MAENNSEEKRPFKERLKLFLTKDIWSFNLKRRGPLLRAIGNTVKVVVIAIRTFVDDKIMSRAAALTYSTLFAIVPILALIFAVVRGFGFENVLDTLVKEGIVRSDSTMVVNDVLNADSLSLAYMDGQTMDGSIMYNDALSSDSLITAAALTESTNSGTLKTVMQFIDGYMQYVSSGAFVGIGLLFLLWSVYSLADNMQEVEFRQLHQRACIIGVNFHRTVERRGDVVLVAQSIIHISQQKISVHIAGVELQRLVDVDHGLPHLLIGKVGFCSVHI